ncbi:hypothetical protein AJ80_09468 [Polytolypa hystricis UAMH7299]|uniref:DUF7514 domain-containing protein n=1 Tax=Polytolypa hystricis (strain UAMH7299) TaxID=1447883 RepID=A0A2B7WQ62_POLH7|nr:hypothetical protein AJ80_09468 [Polytolypa hystricis UAMH7299]
MSSQHDGGGNYWGFLVRADKSATPLFEQLCLGIAKLISKIKPSVTDDLTPDKLAAFYRAVGGNYDTLFLSTPHASLSFIYQSLGCFHTLQPTSNAFEAPSIPALLPHGFVRWQTIQLLLSPDEHVGFLQEAVGKFDIINPSGGAIFPKVIPREAFPSEPDLEMVKWHDSVCKRLENEYATRRLRASSNRSSSRDHPLPDRRASAASMDDGAGEDHTDYFAQRRSSKTNPPAEAPGDALHEAYSPYSRPRHMSHSTSYPAPKRRHADKVNGQAHSYPPQHGSVSPRRKPSARSTTPSGLRRVHELSESSGSDASEDEAPQPVHRTPIEEEDDDDDDDMYPEERERLVPSRHHVRRHSHDPAFSPRRRWDDGDSPPRQRRAHEEPYSPESRHARDPRYTQVPQFHVSTRPRTPHRYQENEYPIHRSPSSRKPKPSTVKFREYIFDDAENISSAPPSPGGGHSRHRRSVHLSGGGSSSPRHWVPRLEPELSSASHAKRKGSAGGGSRSSSSTERARTMSVGGKPMRWDNSVYPMKGRRYITPPSSLSGGVPIDMEMGDDIRGAGRGRWDI